MGYNSFPENGIVFIVICPLVALVLSYMNELNKRGISCVCLSGNQACQDKKGVFYINILYGGELFVNDEIPDIYIETYTGSKPGGMFT